MKVARKTIFITSAAAAVGLIVGIWAWPKFGPGLMAHAHAAQAPVTYMPAVVGAMVFFIVLLLLFSLAAVVGVFVNLFRAPAPEEKVVEPVEPAEQEPPSGPRINSTLTLPLRLETRHVLAVGGTGAGKSQILRAAAVAARKRGDPMIIPTVESALFSSLYDPKMDAIVNPYDKRDTGWSLLSEIEYESDADMLAACLIPSSPSPDAEEWRGYARAALSATLAYVWRTGGTNADVRRIIIKSKFDELKEVWSGTQAEGLLQDDAVKMLASARATCGAVCAPLGRLSPNVGADGWSVTKTIRKLVKAQDAGQRCGTVWITAGERQRRAMLPMLSAVTALAVATILTCSEREDRRIYLICDELGSLPAIEAFEDALKRGRKYGLRCYGAVQSIEQLRDPKRYSRAGAAALLACFSSQFIFRAADAESARWAEETIGRTHRFREMKSESSSETASEHSSSTSSTSYSQQHSIESAILGSEVAGLKDRMAYARVAGVRGAFGPLAVDYVRLVPHSEFFIPKESERRGAGTKEATPAAAADEKTREPERARHDAYAEALAPAREHERTADDDDDAKKNRPPPRVTTTAAARQKRPVDVESLEYLLDQGGDDARKKNEPVRQVNER